MIAHVMFIPLATYANLYHINWFLSSFDKYFLIPVLPTGYLARGYANPDTQNQNSAFR